MELKDQPTTGSSRTLGEPAGEKEDMSDSPETKPQALESAVSKKPHHTQLFEENTLDYPNKS